MKIVGEYIQFSNHEYTLCQLGSVALSEVSTTAAEIRQQSEEAFVAAFADQTLPGDTAQFNRATELAMLAQKLEGLSVTTQDAAELLSDIEMFLDNQTPGEQSAA